MAEVQQQGSRAAVSAEVVEWAERWLGWDKCEETRREVSDLLARGDEAGLRTRLAGRISFGTAGLRGKMCAGFAFMNELTVTQASQGLAAYLQLGSDSSAAAAARGVVIGHDHRHHSLRFAQLTAAAFLSKGSLLYTSSIAHIDLRDPCDPTPPQTN
jgi:phosphoglucomutase